MISIKVDDRELKRLAQESPKAALRAAEITLDALADLVKASVKASMPKVFDRPTPYTLNSLKVTKTKGHNLVAHVWFKDPDRMGQHYLVPQVEGGPRKLKGFERGLGGKYFVPSKSEKLDQYGNMPYGRIVQILSTLRRAEYKSGYMSNATARSKRRNRKPRDFVLLTQQHGKLPPGVYERYQTGVGFGHKTKRTLPFGVWQKGQTVGAFSSVIRARGLRPVLIQQSRRTYRPRLPFERLSKQVVMQRFGPMFRAEFERQRGRA